MEIKRKINNNLTPKKTVDLSKLRNPEVRKQMTSEND